MIPFTRKCEKDQKKNHSDRKQVSVAKRLAEKGGVRRQPEDISG